METAIGIILFGAGVAAFCVADRAVRPVVSRPKSKPNDEARVTTVTSRFHKPSTPPPATERPVSGLGS